LRTLNTDVSAPLIFGFNFVKKSEAYTWTFTVYSFIAGADPDFSRGCSWLLGFTESIIAL